MFAKRYTINIATSYTIIACAYVDWLLSILHHFFADIEQEEGEHAQYASES